MPDYGEILAFLAANPPCLEAERELHASLLELLAQCLRSEQAVFEEHPIGVSFEEHETDEDAASDLIEAITAHHMRFAKVH